MTAEKVTTRSVSTRRDLRHPPTVLHSVKARAKQARPAISVPRGARCRRAMATKRARGAWWRKGRMMKAGIKKKPMAATAQKKNRVQIQPEVPRFASCRSFWWWSCGVSGKDALIVDDELLERF